MLFLLAYTKNLLWLNVCDTLEQTFFDYLGDFIASTKSLLIFAKSALIIFFISNIIYSIFRVFSKSENAET